MPPTPPFQPSTSSPKASSPAPKRRHRPYQPRQGKRHAINSEATFVAAHVAVDTRLRNYYVDNRAGSVRLSRAEFDRVAPPDALFLYAANPTSRIAYVKIAARHIGATVGALASSAPVAFVTLIERRFTGGLKKAATFDVEKLKAWVRRHLPGCSFIGIVEAALYTNVSAQVGHDRAVSWHVHLLVWGINQERLDKLIEKVNRRYRTLLQDVTPGHRRMLKSAGVASRLYYMLKGQISAYRVWPNRETVVDSETGEISKRLVGGFQQAKDDLRPGDLARMVQVLGDRTINQLTFAAGEGEPILAAINREALAPFRRWEEKPRPRWGSLLPVQARQPPTRYRGPPKPVRRSPSVPKVPPIPRTARPIAPPPRHQTRPSPRVGKSGAPRPTRLLVKPKPGTRRR